MRLVAEAPDLPIVNAKGLAGILCQAFLFERFQLFTVTIGPPPVSPALSKSR